MKVNNLESNELSEKTLEVVQCEDEKIVEIEEVSAGISPVLTELGMNLLHLLCKGLLCGLDKIVDDFFKNRKHNYDFTDQDEFAEYEKKKFGRTSETGALVPSDKGLMLSSQLD